MPDQRETVVVKDSGSGAGVILGIIVLLIVVAAGWYFLIGPGAGAATSPGDININVELPSVAPAAS